LSLKNNMDVVLLMTPDGGIYQMTRHLSFTGWQI